jgi:hypothetical protein
MKIYNGVDGYGPPWNDLSYRHQNYSVGEKTCFEKVKTRA